MKNNVFKEIAKGLLVTVVGFLILEAGLRIAYFGRNWMVTEIPVPYVFGDDHGPIPPWLDGLRILEPDKVLIWKNRPNIQRRYIDVFIPAHGEREKTAILRRFLPQPPDSLKGRGRLAGTSVRLRAIPSSCRIYFDGIFQKRISRYSI